MANLSQIAKVVIQLSTATIAKANFGIPLIVAPTSAFTERVKIYSNYDDAVSDKLEAKTLLAINSCFGQSPRPGVVYVGRRDVVSSVITTQLTTIVAGNQFTMSFNGEPVSYIAKSGDTVEAVYAGVAAAMNATGVISAAYEITSSVNGVSLAASDPTTAKSLVAGLNLAIDSAGSSTNIAADLTLINRANKAWYGFALQERSDALILQAAIWGEAQTKLFFACSGTTDIWAEGSTDDVASQLQMGSYYRTALIAHKQAATQYPEMAWMGRCFTISPGGETWALKVLTTITPSDFDDGEQAIIWGKNANTYEQYSDSIYLTNPGKVSQGEWIDIIRGRDWLVDTIQKNCASTMIRAKKIPYTNAGIQTLVNSVRGSLSSAQKAGVLAPDEQNSEGETVPGFIIDYPNAADVDADTKASRVLYLSFVGILAGAIHVTDISGTLAYNYDGVAA